MDDNPYQASQAETPPTGREELLPPESWARLLRDYGLGFVFLPIVTVVSSWLVRNRLPEDIYAIFFILAGSTISMFTCLWIIRQILLRRKRQ
ncbi:MAG: hypothetical protein SGJ20_03120 [Planctomycetota bacterium]|nr:hypothetical protein [Planctomycetota bacterium]